ncbi:hypothetical protein ACVISU_003329 [Bradyrhizobium sp. USDA 4452]
MKSVWTMLGLTLLAACLAAAPARAGDPPEQPAPAPPCDVPAYLLSSESALPKVTDAVKASQPLNVLVVGSRSSTIPGNEASAYPATMHGSPEGGVSDGQDRFIRRITGKEHRGGDRGNPR